MMGIRGYKQKKALTIMSLQKKQLIVGRVGKENLVKK